MSTGHDQGGPRGFHMDDVESQTARAPEGKAKEPPEISFAGFVLSLSASAMVHLGELPEGVAERPEPNLPLARHSIDILELLEHKTRGNLDADEQRLLADVLHTLRMKYVARSRA